MLRRISLEAFEDTTGVNPWSFILQKEQKIEVDEKWLTWFFFGFLGLTAGVIFQWPDRAVSSGGLRCRPGRRHFINPRFFSGLD